MKNGRHKAAEYLFATIGQSNAYKAWLHSTQDESSVFEVWNLPWDEDVHDFVETLRAAGVTEFAVTERSTALIESLHRLDGEGCAMLGLCKVAHSLPQYCGKKIIELEAILFET